MTWSPFYLTYITMILKWSKANLKSCPMSFYTEVINFCFLRVLTKYIHSTESSTSLRFVTPPPLPSNTSFLFQLLLYLNLIPSVVNVWAPHAAVYQQIQWRRRGCMVAWYREGLPRGTPGIPALRTPQNNSHGRGENVWWVLYILIRYCGITMGS